MSLHLLNGKNDHKGEIAISGPQLAEGYWGDKEKTDLLFTYIKINGSMTRVYLTGDSAYIKDGLYFFWGRKDNQVKIKGFRIEIGEIDSAFLKVGVSVCKTIFYDKKLITFVEGSKTYNIMKIREQLIKILPSYALPLTFLLY